MARWLFASLILALSVSSGCCCLPNCGGCGSCGGCCFPEPIVWNGCCNECGPGPCESCADCCGECGIFPFLNWNKTCGKGCGEIYWGEWYSDPPDCCDPCDQCHGQWTGPHGYCCLGPCQRILAAFHGYRYCPPPDCGPTCGPLCQKASCGATFGCDHCGGAGCASCGGTQHDAFFSEDSSQVVPHGTHLTPHAAGHAPSHQPSILHENWDTPKTQPVPGKPIHKAQQLPRGQMTRSHQPQPPQLLTQQTMQRGQPMRYTQPQAWGRSPQQTAEERRAAAASAVRRANYQR
jgi:hypothetical protein